MSENYNLKKEANLTKYTEEEIYATLDKVTELEKLGKSEEAYKLGIQGIPSDPETANTLKGLIGLDYLIEEGFNLSEAVEKYGVEWLEEYAS